MGLRSVNGSDNRMGCTNPTVNPSTGFTSCSSQYDTGFLTDGNVPTINMSQPNWAADLVTIQRGYTTEIPFDHALMTFQFSASVVVTTIYLDLFICPKSGIGAPHISVIGSMSLHLDYSSLDNSETDAADLLAIYQPRQTTCECRMSTVVVRIQEGERLHPVLHILIYFPDYRQEWFHVGEVRFSDEPVPNEEPTGGVWCESYRRIPGAWSYNL